MEDRTGRTSEVFGAFPKQFIRPQQTMANNSKETLSILNNLESNPLPPAVVPLSFHPHVLTTSKVASSLKSSSSSYASSSKSSRVRPSPQKYWGTPLMSSWSFLPNIMTRIHLFTPHSSTGSLRFDNHLGLTPVRDQHWGSKGCGTTCKGRDPCRVASCGDG